MLGGKPLIAWSIEAAKTSGVVDRVVVSTDDEQIARVAKEWGAEVPFLRPAELSGDDASHVPVVLHALDWLETHDRYMPESLILLQPTSPLRSAEDIQAAVALFEGKKPQAVLGVCEPLHHPWLIKVENEQGWLKDFVPKPAGYLPRQKFPKVYAVNGAIYLVNTVNFRQLKSFTPPRTLPLIMPPERSVDIDTESDLNYAEYLLRRSF